MGGPLLLVPEEHLYFLVGVAWEGLELMSPAVWKEAVFACVCICVCMWV